MHCYHFITGQKGVIINKMDNYYGIYWLNSVNYYWQDKENILIEFNKPFKFQNYGINLQK